MHGARETRRRRRRRRRRRQRLLPVIVCLCAAGLHNTSKRVLRLITSARPRKSDDVGSTEQPATHLIPISQTDGTRYKTSYVVLVGGHIISTHLLLVN